MFPSCWPSQPASAWISSSFLTSFSVNPFSCVDCHHSMFVMHWGIPSKQKQKWSECMGDSRHWCRSGGTGVLESKCPAYQVFIGVSYGIGRAMACSSKPTSRVHVGCSTFSLTWWTCGLVWLAAMICAPGLFGREMLMEQISHQQISKYRSSEKECLLRELNLNGITPCFVSS